ncbi:LPXTG cell wall anchor domain-containing protein [Staphylococcus simulans]|uniref:LPXTG cell wall anchor domain-containing protein n=1 Tax=Staphylococcus simulans TaxID=1286 RepID=UPI0021D32E45|nr:LPXTG cell wall anchor domain-containing protein [Staphylococcus simulans]UXR30576.1 LPXTG cell wall anchor domain-containing protein [Staphylococcus simulans]
MPVPNTVPVPNTTPDTVTPGGNNGTPTSDTHGYTGFINVNNDHGHKFVGKQTTHKVVYHNVEQPQPKVTTKPKQTAKALPETGSDDTAALVYGAIMAGLGATTVLGSRRRKEEE